MSRSRKSTAPSRRELEAIDGGLDEIAAYFGWEKEDSHHEVEESAEDGEDEPAADDGDEEPYEQDQRRPGVDREEVEIAVDAFLSHLIQERLIRPADPRRPPSFSEVFETFLGEEHAASKAAETFETCVKGYFGWIDDDSMESARKQFLEIRELIRQELERRNDG